MAALFFSAASFAISSVANLTTSLTRTNTLRHSTRGFLLRLDNFRGVVNTCQNDLDSWNDVWSYEQNPTEVNQFLWGRYYQRVTDCKIYIDQQIVQLMRHLADVAGIEYDPQQMVSIVLEVDHLMRAFSFALFSEDSLGSEIGQLQQSIEELQALSERRLREIRGSPHSPELSPLHASNLGHLHGLWIDLSQKLHQVQSTSEWALELPTPDADGMDARHWLPGSRNYRQALEIFRLGFAFSDSRGELNRLSLRYQLRQRITEDWSLQIVSIAMPQASTAAPYNPEIWRKSPYEQKTDPLRELFLRGFFNGPIIRKQWEVDQASLLFALCNWAILLWTSPWTADICCMGIRLVNGRAENRPESTRMHCLSVYASHQQHTDEDNCQHTTERLRNLGLVLVEIICATPFRWSPVNRYEIWEARTWTRIREDEILSRVYNMSNQSDGLRRAVQFCFEETDHDESAEALAHFQASYFEQVLIPFSTFNTRARENNKTLPSILKFWSGSWPNDAWV